MQYASSSMTNISS